MINCIVRRRRTRVRFRTFALVRTSTTGIGEGDSTRTIPRQQILAHPTCPCLPARVLGRHWRGVYLLRPSLPPVRGARLVSKATLRLRRVGRFGDEEILDRDGSTAGRLISPGCVQDVAARCQQKESWTSNAITMPHTKGRFSLPGDPKKERDRHKLAEFCHAYRQRHSTELLESWRRYRHAKLKGKGSLGSLFFCRFAYLPFGSCLILALPLRIRVTSLFIVGSGNAT